MSTGPSYKYDDQRKWAQTEASDEESPAWLYDDLPQSASSPDDVLGEIGLVLVVILGIVVAINLVLVGLHIA